MSQQQHDREYRAFTGRGFRLDLGDHDLDASSIQRASQGQHDDQELPASQPRIWPSIAALSAGSSSDGMAAPTLQVPRGTNMEKQHLVKQLTKAQQISSAWLYDDANPLEELEGEVCQFLTEVVTILSDETRVTPENAMIYMNRFVILSDIIHEKIGVFPSAGDTQEAGEEHDTQEIDEEHDTQETDDAPLSTIMVRKRPAKIPMEHVDSFLAEQTTEERPTKRVRVKRQLTTKKPAGAIVLEIE